MTETITGTNRSAGVSQTELLDQDSHPVHPPLREESRQGLRDGNTRVPAWYYTSREFHDLEVEKLWKRVWQFACREEEIPEPGDHTLYEIADTSVLIVRGEDRRIRAFANTCLHRGRALKDRPGRSSELRCPFHAWEWNLDGTLKAVPCRWDFPHVERDDFKLPEYRTARWGGFVFVSLEQDGEPFEQFIGDLPSHFERWPLEDRYKEAHVAHLMRCNWKAAQEAFMEAYHVVATHPQILAGIGDANSQYDAWDTYSRAMTANMTPSPHLDREPSEQEMLESIVTTSIDAEPAFRVPEGMTARQLFAQMARMQLQATVPSATLLTDAEMNDSFYYSLFPNMHPWGAYNRITYRFRPNGNDPDSCIFEVMLMAPSPEADRRPDPAKVVHLGVDDDWTEALVLGPLAKIFQQDSLNLPWVQRGVRNIESGQVVFANYAESKIRDFHVRLQAQLGIDYAEMMAGVPVEILL